MYLQIKTVEAKYLRSLFIKFLIPLEELHSYNNTIPTLLL